MTLKDKLNDIFDSNPTGWTTEEILQEIEIEKEKKRMEIEKYVDKLNKKYSGQFYIELDDFEGKPVARITRSFAHLQVVESNEDVDKLVKMVEDFFERVEAISKELRDNNEK
jgi:DNA-binding ferritin-like protein